MSQEYIDRNGGIDIDKLRAVAKVPFGKRYPEQNPMKFDNEKVQYFSDLWWSRGKEASIEQKNEAGIAFMSLILELDEEVIGNFIEGGNYEAWDTVGMKQSGIPLETDSSGFWSKVQNIFPGLHSENDRKFLIEEGGVIGVFHFMFQLDPILNEESPVMRKLNSNAHAYK